MASEQRDNLSDQDVDPDAPTQMMKTASDVERLDTADVQQIETQLLQTLQMTLTIVFRSPISKKGML